jgi:hypothetical protein
VPLEIPRTGVPAQTGLPQALLTVLGKGGIEGIVRGDQDRATEPRVLQQFLGLGGIHRLQEEGREEVRKEGRREGRREGMKEGRKEGSKEGRLDGHSRPAGCAESRHSAGWVATAHYTARCTACALPAGNGFLRAT